MIHTAVAYLLTSQSQVRSFLDERLTGAKRDAGLTTVEQVVIGAGLFILAVGLVAAINALVGSYQAKLIAP